MIQNGFSRRGRQGKNFQILGYYDTYAQMTAAVTNPEAGDAYGVGTAAPYIVYVWDGVNGEWKNNGTMQGADGTTFTPSVSSAGVISWTNDGGRENPPSVDLVSAVIAALPTWTGGSY